MGGLGEVWHYFDEELGFPVHLVNASDLSAATLADADVLVLPAGGYSRTLSEERLGAVQTWVEAGGTLVALESAVGFLVGKDGFGLQRKGAGDTRRDSLATFGARERTSLSGSVTGAVYRVSLDASHPLAFGVGNQVFTILRADDAYAYLEEGWNVGTLRGNARVAGFTGSVAAKRLRDALVYGVQEKGRGSIIYLADGPLFRRFWRGTELIFANAVFRF